MNDPIPVYNHNFLTENETKYAIETKNLKLDTKGQISNIFLYITSKLIRRSFCQVQK